MEDNILRALEDFFFFLYRWLCHSVLNHECIKEVTENSSKGPQNNRLAPPASARDHTMYVLTSAQNSGPTQHLCRPKWPVGTTYICMKRLLFNRSFTFPETLGFSLMRTVCSFSHEVNTCLCVHLKCSGQAVDGHHSPSVAERGPGRTG